MLLPHLEPVELEKHFVLFEIGQKFDYVYFLEKGVNSIIATMEDGTSIEVGMAGYEGLAPIAALFGDDISTQHNVMQLPGSGYRIKLSKCRAAFKDGTTMQKAVFRFANTLLSLGMQTAACNRLHSLEQRLARWLLVCHDRFGADALPLTQEYLSVMLGVRRVGVTEAAGDLQRSGLINYTRGLITIIDRVGLEMTACECYACDRERFETACSN